MDVGKMTVSEVLDAIAEGRSSTADIAERLQVSERTVQRKIKALGYKWSQQSGRHEPTGEKYQPENDDKSFIDLFPDVVQKIAQITSDEVASASQSVSKPRKPKELTGVLAMYLGDNQNDRIQRNYYMQKDIIDVINRVPMLKRSDFINDCLRQYFKEHGIL